MRLSVILLTGILTGLTGVVSTHAQSKKDKIKLDPNHSIAVKNLKLTREDGVMMFDEGIMHFAEPIDGKHFIVVFEGKGLFKMNVPDIYETDHLHRIYGVRNVLKPFEQAFLFFCDSTYDEISKSAAILPTTIPNKTNDFMKHALNFTYNYTFLFSIFNPNVYPFFYCHLGETTGKTIKEYNINSDECLKKELFFQVVPDSDEPVQLLRNYRTLSSAYHKEPVVQFQTAAQREGRISSDTYNDFYRIDSQKIHLTFEDNLDVSGYCDITIQPLLFDLRYVFFMMDEEIHVDSILINSKNTEFYNDEGDVWIRMDSLFQLGHPNKARLYYRGKTAKRIEDYIFFRDGWYPRTLNRSFHKSHFDMYFDIPKQFQMVGTGELIETTKNKKTITYHWRTHEPVLSVAINIGFLKKFEVKDDRIPPVTIMMSEVGYKAGKNMEKQVGADVTNSYLFFQDILGPSPVKRLYVSEFPYFHGEAYSGLINLSWYTFHSTSESGGDEIFRAHEVAHQWWGLGIQPATYHDWWLAEGFAEYFGLWYLQSALSDNKKFLGYLSKHRKKIIENRKGWFEQLLGDDQEAGPVWMGRRTSTSTSRGDYGLIVYLKGSWIMHMLRNMMLDFKTMSDDRFKLMLKDFYETYSGKKVTTDDFRRIVEKHTGMDMTWFFDQWVYGTQLPKYEFSYIVNPVSEGKYKVKCRVSQTGVGEGFQMFVPIHIDFGNNQYLAMRLLIKDPVKEFELPLLPLPPEKITFNPLESVLCDYDEVKWKD